MDRPAAARAEQIRAARERLTKLRLGAGPADEIFQIDDDASDAEALLAAARHETALAVQQAKMAWRTALICAFCVALGIGAGAWAGVKVFRKINRDTIEMERIAAEARTTSAALMRFATESSKFATRCTLPSSVEPRTIAAGACVCL